MGKHKNNHNSYSTNTQVTKDTKPNRWHSPWTITGLAIFVAAILLFMGINKHHFWDDEANTAIMGRNIIRTFSATAWNGRNLLSYGMNGSLTTTLKKSSVPPLQYIIAGISQTIFGDTTAGTRVMFILLGLLTMLFTALWYREEFASKRWWLPAVILALSVAFLLYVRQARYYAPALCFSFGLLYFWAYLPRTKHPVIISITACLFGLMVTSTHYIFAAACGVIILASMARTNYHNKRSYILLAIFVGCTAIAIPLFYHYSPGTVRFGLELSSTHLDRFTNWLVKGAVDASNFEFVPVGIIFFAFLSLLFKKSAERKTHWINLAFICLYLGLTLAACAFFSPQQVLKAPTDMRYFINLIPLGAIAAAIIFEMLAESRQKWLPWVYLVILLSSNVLYLNFFREKHEFSWRIKDYISEIVEPYPSGTAALQEYLQANVNVDDCIFMVPLYTNIINMYYRPEQKFCGLVSNQNTFAKANKDILREDLFYERAIPEYFIVGNRNPSQFVALLNHLYGPDTYRLETILPYLWKEATRPEIPWHRFKPIIVNPRAPQYGGIMIFKRTANPAHFPTMSPAQFERYVKF